MNDDEIPKDDGSVEYAVKAALASFKEYCDGSVAAWLVTAEDRIQSGAYRNNAEAGRIAREALEQDRRWGGDRDYRENAPERVARLRGYMTSIAALTTSTGSEPEETRDEREGLDARAEAVQQASDEHGAGALRTDGESVADRSDLVVAPGLTPPSEDGERVLLWDGQERQYIVFTEDGGDICWGDLHHASRCSREEAEQYVRSFPEARIATLDGWIEHDGGECPVGAETWVEVRHGGGREVGRADEFRWKNVSGLGDIVDFRPIPPTDERASEDVLPPLSEPTKMKMKLRPYPKLTPLDLGTIEFDDGMDDEPERASEDVCEHCGNGQRRFYDDPDPTVRRPVPCVKCGRYASSYTRAPTLTERERHVVAWIIRRIGEMADDVKPKHLGMMLQRDADALDGGEG